MSNLMPSDVKELVMPAIEQQIKKKIEDAFKLSIYVQDIGIVHKFYERIKNSYLENAEDSSNSLNRIFEELDDLDSEEEEPDEAVNLITRRPINAKRKKTVRNSRRNQKRPKSKQRDTSSVIKSQYKGVSWDRATGKWRSRIFYKGRHMELGKFVKEEEAARAYDKIKYKASGDVAFLNFPDEFI